MAITIQEVLADLKYRAKRAEKKGATVLSNLFRSANTIDKMAAEGGTPLFVEREAQAMRDIAYDIIKARVAIQRSNLETSVTCEGVTMTVAEWIVWKREVHPIMYSFLSQAQGIVRKQSSTPRKLDEPDVVYHMSEQDILRKLETLQAMYEKLDGLLSLNNATATVEL